MGRTCVFVAGSLATLFLLLTGCGSDAVTPQTENRSNPGQPPERPPLKPGSGAGVVFAVNHLFLGDTDRNDKKVTGSWKQYGYNIDGKVSATSSKDLCQPASAATPADIYPDGLNGIDNSFGKLLLPLISAALDPSTEVNNALANGDFTVLLSVEGLGQDSSYNPLVTKLYAGAKLGSAPKWDGTDKWPVVPDLLTDETDITSAKVIFPESYVVNNTWVSGARNTFDLNLALSGASLNLTIRSATVTMDLDADRKGSVNGTISGLIETEGFLTELKKVLGLLLPSTCTGSGADTILEQVLRASDILDDGTQDPEKVCNAVSIGLGFTAKQVELGAIAPRAVPSGDPCNPGGSGGGGDAGGGGSGGANSGGAGGN